MKHEPTDPQSSRDLRLTDYLCGELDSAAARALEAELAADPVLRARLAELRRAFELVRADAPALTEGLPPARRDSLRAAAAAAAQVSAPAPRLLRFPAWMRAAAAFLVVAGGVLFWQASRPEAAPGSSGDLNSKLGMMGYASESKRGADRAPAGAPVPSEEFASELMALGYGGSEPAPQVLRIEPFSDLGALAATEENRGQWDANALTDDAFDSLALLSTGLPPTVGAPAAPATPTVPGASLAPSGGGGAAADPIRQRDQDTSLGFLGEALQQFGYVDKLEASEESERAAGRPLTELTDGYGRSFRDVDVLAHLRRHGNETPRDMFFRYYGDNAVVRATDDPLSTFAADVDTASYALARGYVTQGAIPPKAAVRTEEFVNSFQQELPAPQKEDFAIFLEAAPTPYGAPGSLLLRCGLKAREVSRAERKPLNLVFVVDKSGSMATGNRLALVQNALELLVDQIRDDDTIGLVAFDSEGHEILQPTPGAERWKIREALRGITSGGSTNAAEGLFLGYQMAESAFRKGAVNRVVIASDGVANTGETDQRKILEKVQRSAEAEIDLTSIGVGMGNHNDAFLERLADEGEGSCHYVDDLDEAKRVLVDGFTGTMQVVAREVKIQLEFDPAVVGAWRQLGYENRALRHEDFRDDRVDAGEVGAGHEVVALYELQLQPEADPGRALATLRLRWKPDGGREFRETSAVLHAGEARARWSAASPRLRLAGAVAQYAEFLRRSVHARGDSYETLLQEAGRLARELPEDAQVAEFRDLVGRTAALVSRLWPEDDLALLIDEARRARLLEAELECVRERTPQVEELLKEARLHNADLERQLQDLLQPR